MEDYLQEPLSLLQEFQLFRVLLLLCYKTLGLLILTYSNIKDKAARTTSSFNLDNQSRTPSEVRLTLLPGYGSQSTPTVQDTHQLNAALAQAASAATSYSSAPASVNSSPQFATVPSAAPGGPDALQDYQHENEVPTITVTNDAVIVADTSLARGPSQCPAAPSLSPQQCQGAVNACWSVGVNDVDCPGNSLCW